MLETMTFQTIARRQSGCIHFESIGSFEELDLGTTHLQCSFFTITDRFLERWLVERQTIEMTSWWRDFFFSLSRARFSEKQLCAQLRLVVPLVDFEHFDVSYMVGKRIDHGKLLLLC